MAGDGDRGERDGERGKRSLAKGALRRPIPGFQLPMLTPTLTWERYGHGGLLREKVDPDDPATWVWHAGHVTAILDVGPRSAANPLGDLLVGTHTGGVYRVSMVGTPRATPLSERWDNPDITCLAHGPDGDQHLYAGCAHVAFVRDLIYESPPGGGDWHPIATVDDGLGRIYAMAVVQLAGPPILDRRLVCGTDNGVWIAAIPAPTDTNRQYHWQQATWPSGVSPRDCSGLVGFGSTIVASARDSTVWTGSFHRFLPGLTLSAATVPTVASPGLTSLATAADGARLYCLVGQSASKPTLGHVAALLVSDNLGRTWRSVDPMVTRLDGVARTGSSLVTDTSLAGEQGGSWNNCIAVSPIDRLRVVAGWQLGIFSSGDGGSTFAKRTNDSQVGRTPIAHQTLHEDVHALFFDPRDPKGETLYIGSDGGLAYTTAATRAFRESANLFVSRVNSALSNLQFESLPEREFYGTFSPSPEVAGLVAGGLQDNADAWRTGLGNWQQLGYGDGAGVVFCSNGLLLFDIQSAVQAGTWNGTSIAGGAVVPVVADDGSSDGRGFSNPALDPVTHPRFTRDGQLLHAIGGFGATASLAKDEVGIAPNQVFGLFADAGGADPKWRHLVDLPTGSFPWAFASADGSRVFIASTVDPNGNGVGQQAFVHSLDTASGGLTQLGSIPPIIDGQADEQAAVGHLVLHADGTLLAGYNALLSTRDGYGGQVLAWTDARGSWARAAGHGLVWPGHGIFGLAVDDWGVCYASTDDAVYTAPGPNGPWQRNSDGLVQRPHLGHIRFVRYPNGGVELFASTFGWGAWHAHWSRPSNRKPLPHGAVAFNRLIGSLVDGKLYQIGPHGLTPVGPIDPELMRRAQAEFADLVAGADRLADTLGEVGADATGGDVAGWSALRNSVERGLAVLVNASAAPTDAARRTDLVAAATRDVSRAAAGLEALAHRGSTALVRAGVPAKLAETLTSTALVVAARVRQLGQLEQRIVK